MANDLGAYPRAWECYQMCLDIDLDRLGEDHPDTKNTQSSIEILKDMMN